MMTDGHEFTPEFKQKIANMAEIEARIKRLDELEAEIDSFSSDGHAERLRQLEGLVAQKNHLFRTGCGPLVGMPCTYHVGSDSYAAVVETVSPSGKTVTVNRQGCLSDAFRLRKDGIYKEVRSDHTYLTFLRAETKLDPSF